MPQTDLVQISVSVSQSRIKTSTPVISFIEKLVFLENRKRSILIPMQFGIDIHLLIIHSQESLIFEVRLIEPSQMRINNRTLCLNILCRIYFQRQHSKC